MVHRSSRARLQWLLRAVQPQIGALANVMDAVSADRVAAAERGWVTRSLAELDGPSSWSALPGSSPAAPDRCHAVVTYDTDADLLARLTSYVVDGLAAGEVCVVIATPEHRSGLRRRLRINGLGDDLARLVELDAEELLSTFVVDGWPDAGLFDEQVAELVRTHLRAGSGLRAFGEMVGLLVGRDQVQAALHLEKLWDALQLELGFPLLCAYPAAALAGLDDAGVLARHTHVVPVPG